MGNVDKWYTILNNVRLYNCRHFIFNINKAIEGCLLEGDVTHFAKQSGHFI